MENQEDLQQDQTEEAELEISQNGQAGISPEQLELFEGYIASVRWQEAKTYAKTTPHEYTIRWWAPDLDGTFCKIVQFIRDVGVTERFFKAKYIYFYHKGLKYWTMGDPIQKRTWVLNRAEGKPNPT